MLDKLLPYIFGALVLALLSAPLLKGDTFEVQKPSVALPSIYAKPPPKPKPATYYPTVETPTPGVMYDYRPPSYDIYQYRRAPVRRRGY